MLLSVEALVLSALFFAPNKIIGGWRESWYSSTVRRNNGSM